MQQYIAAILLAGVCAITASADHEQAPINYSKATPDNCIHALQQSIDAGKAKLQYTEDRGYLKSVLDALDVPLSSQVLVFSKTSLQRSRIGPKTPRAIYFNDDVYIGYCHRGDVLEISVADTKLGTVFYTLEQRPEETPRFVRQNDNCLICHGSSTTHGYPGHVVRSVLTDWSGMPALSLGSTKVTTSTPFSERWGGWYVTGKSGDQQHRGNLVLESRFDRPPFDFKKGTNLTDLRDKFFVKNYLSPHSDLVALMVLSHQAEMHNRLTQANFETRKALFAQEELDRLLERPSTSLSSTTRSRIKSVCEPLVETMLFMKEAKLTAPIEGTSTFATEFAQRQPRDRQGRSLREMDLKTRLFRYPCSYLIYSDSFQKLPQPAKDYVYERLWELTSPRYISPENEHITITDRQTIREILRETISDLPDYWKEE